MMKEYDKKKSHQRSRNVVFVSEASVREEGVVTLSINPTSRVTFSILANENLNADSESHLDGDLALVLG